MDRGWRWWLTKPTGCVMKRCGVGERSVTARFCGVGILRRWLRLLSLYLACRLVTRAGGSFGRWGRWPWICVRWLTAAWMALWTARQMPMGCGTIWERCWCVPKRGSRWPMHRGVTCACLIMLLAVPRWRGRGPWSARRQGRAGVSGPPRSWPNAGQARDATP